MTGTNTNHYTTADLSRWELNLPCCQGEVEVRSAEHVIIGAPGAPPVPGKRNRQRGSRPPETGTSREGADSWEKEQAARHERADSTRKRRRRGQVAKARLTPGSAAVSPRLVGGKMPRPGSEPGTIRSSKAGDCGAPPRVTYVPQNHKNTVYF